MTEHAIDPERDSETDTDIDPASPPQTFVQWLIEQRNGALQSELSEHLAEVVGACMEHDKPGSVTLTIKIAPRKQGGNQLFVADDVKAKVPEADKEVPLFYGDSRGRLSRRDPRQPELPLDIAPNRPTRKAH